jgi:hypothetical protein
MNIAETLFLFTVFTSKMFSREITKMEIWSFHHHPPLWTNNSQSGHKIYHLNWDTWKQKGRLVATKQGKIN